MQDPHAPPPSGYNKKKSTSLWTNGGRKEVSECDKKRFIHTNIYVKGHCCATFPQVTVEDHLKFVEVLRPNVFECLCDSSPSIGNKPKRIGKSVDRTLRFLDETVESRATNKVRRTVTCLAHSQSITPVASFPASFPGLPCLIPRLPNSSFSYCKNWSLGMRLSNQ